MIRRLEPEHERASKWLQASSGVELTFPRQTSVQGLLSTFGVIRGTRGSQGRHCAEVTQDCVEGSIFSAVVPLPCEAPVPSWQPGVALRGPYGLRLPVLLVW
jgi:hypothetical protein